MPFLPVVLRELRAEARRPANYWVRAGCGAVFAAVFWAVMSAQHRTQAGQGIHLFAALNATLFTFILLAVPILAADCISRERREGTLGLLFLTPLTAPGIVVGKLACHALRALTLFLVAIPVLAVPLLLGGVGWRDLTMAALIDSTVFVVALSASLIASSFHRDWTRSVITALALTLATAFVLLSMHALITQWLFYSHPPQAWVRGGWLPDPWRQAWSDCWEEPLLQRAEWIFSLATGWYGSKFQLRYGFLGYGWNWSGNFSSAGFQACWLGWVATLFLNSLLGLMAAIRFAAWRLRRAWQEAPPPVWQQTAARTLTEARFLRGILRRRLRAMLEANPIGWLQQRAWGARMTRWSWCLIIILAECAVMAEFQSNVFSEGWLVSGQYVLGALLLLSLAFCAAASFKEERETGALELLLVTPLTPRQIILGRVRGLWGQFLPALLLLAAAWGWLVYDLSDYLVRYGHIDIQFWTLGFPAWVASSFLTVPFIGLYFSARRLHFLNAWALTGLAGLLLPGLAGGFFPRLLALGHVAFLGEPEPGWIRHDPFAPMLADALSSLTQIVFAVVALNRLRRNLVRRTFALRRP